MLKIIVLLHVRSFFLLLHSSLSSRSSAVFIHIHAPPSHILHQGLSLFLVSMDYLSIDYMQLKPSRIPKSNCSLRMVSCNEFYASFSQPPHNSKITDDVIDDRRSDFCCRVAYSRSLGYLEP